MTVTESGKPLSFRLDAELSDRIDRFLGAMTILGQGMTRTELVRDALESYLSGFEDEVRRKAAEELT